MVGLLMPIKDRLKALRKAAELTQQALAVKAGLSISAVVQIENGSIPDPRLSTVRALAKGLGVTLDDLGAEDDEGELPVEEPAPEPPPAEAKPEKAKKPARKPKEK
jgi:transcriptional regulator with XRE-family HTH domain